MINLLENGGFINPKLGVEYMPNIGYGFKALQVACCFCTLFRVDLLLIKFQPISTYETLCTIPLTTCFYCVSKNIDDSLGKMARQLAIEKAAARKDESLSFFAPFISLLPEDTTFLPGLWSDEKLARIKNTALAEDAIRMKSEWLSQSAQYTEDISLQEALWARSTLQSRAFSFRLPNNFGQEDLPALQACNLTEQSSLVVFFPFISLANHDDKKFCTVSLGLSA